MSNGDAGTEAFVDYVRVTSTRAQYADNGEISMYAPTDADGQTVRSFTVSGFIAEPKVLEVSNPLNPLRSQLPIALEPVSRRRIPFNMAVTTRIAIGYKPDISNRL